MKFIGHVSCATIVAVPIIYFKEQLPSILEASSLSDYQLLLWTNFWSVFPDVDIILQKKCSFIKHRGMLTHSLYSAIFFPSLCLIYYLLSYNLLVPKLLFINPFTVILAFVGIFMHLLGDAMTKTG
ncbi:MAG: metal-dependent hydrolase, partial [Lentisphaeria bacterium]